MLTGKNVKFFHLDWTFHLANFIFAAFKTGVYCVSFFIHLSNLLTHTYVGRIVMRGLLFGLPSFEKNILAWTWGI